MSLSLSHTDRERDREMQKKGTADDDDDEMNKFEWLNAVLMKWDMIYKQYWVERTNDNYFDWTMVHSLYTFG